MSTRPSPRVDRLGTPKTPAIRFTRAMTFVASWFTHLLRSASLLEKIATLREEIQRLNGLNTLMMQTEDKQISLTDPDARSMATSGRGSGMVGYNVQSAVDTKHHLIVTHEVT